MKKVDEVSADGECYSADPAEVWSAMIDAALQDCLAAAGTLTGTINMNPLVERLREGWEPGDDIYEACDLIERQEREIKDCARVEFAQRGEIATLTGEAKKMRGLLFKAADEIERLRKELADERMLKEGWIEEYTKLRDMGDMTLDN